MLWLLQAGEIVLISSWSHCKVKLELKDENYQEKKKPEMTRKQTDMEKARINHQLIFTCDSQQRKPVLFLCVLLGLLLSLYLTKQTHPI